MGQLVNGQWSDEWYDTKSSGGKFVRDDAAFRAAVEADAGSHHPAAKGRYHLYVCNACPWAHRTLIFRKLKGLEHVIGLSVVDPLWGASGWTFSEEPGCVPDALFESDHLYQIYVRAKADYTGRVTVPVLWDKERGTIVSNESSEIIRMFNSAFNAYGDASLDFYPQAMRPEIDQINETIYHSANNGVYKAGFASTQEAYEEAVGHIFTTLEELEERLGRGRYLLGDRLTEADWRLFTTLVRFDPVYVGHFKCNVKRIVDYPNLWAYTRDLYQVPGVADTVNMDHIKRHYYGSHPQVNPTGVVPVGPQIDFEAPHGRG